MQVAGSTMRKSFMEIKYLTIDMRSKIDGIGCQIDYWKAIRKIMTKVKQIVWSTDKTR